MSSLSSEGFSITPQYSSAPSIATETLIPNTENVVSRLIVRDFPTFQRGTDFIHYTCQSIPEGVLLQCGIRMIGESFGIGNSEVLAFPIALLEKKMGRRVDPPEAQMLIERYIVELDRAAKRRKHH